MRSAIVALGVLTGLAACSGKDEPSGERLTADDVVVEVRTDEDGRWRACVASAHDFALPDPAPCVGPHDGTRGPSHSWSSATRVGDDVLLLVIMGKGDAMGDAWYATADSAQHPISVAAGVLRDYGGNIVCGTYLSGGKKYHFDTGIAVESPGGGASMDIVPCAAQDGPVRLRPWIVDANAAPSEADADSAGAVVARVASFYGELDVAVELEPTERVVDPARAALLVDFPEAASACATVRAALAIPARLDTVDVVLGGHVSSTSPMRRLYGVSCEGRSEDCGGGRGGMVLIDRSAADEIDLGVVAAHEVGHVLGLRHPFEADCGGGAAPDGAANLMALERDLPAQPYRAVSLSNLTLTADQVRLVARG